MSSLLLIPYLLSIAFSPPPPPPPTLPPLSHPLSPCSILLSLFFLCQSTTISSFTSIRLFFLVFFSPHPVFVSTSVLPCTPLSPLTLLPLISLPPPTSPLPPPSPLPLFSFPSHSLSPQLHLYSTIPLISISYSSLHFLFSLLISIIPLFPLPPPPSPILLLLGFSQSERNSSALQSIESAFHCCI